ncbi:MAG: glycoside hydrolase family 3 N-terminal domain-containing protein [Planctomycetota bacterium]
MQTFSKSIFVLFLAGGIAACEAPRAAREDLTTNPPPAPDAPDAIERPVDLNAYIHSMTLEEKVGQCFIVSGNAHFMNDAHADVVRLRKLITEYHVGGIIWYRSKVYETAILNAQFQSLAKTPLIISADLEAGMGMRFDDTPWAPWPMAIAATGDPKFAEQLGYLTAIEARALGITQIYAPVADVNVNPKNPVINTRSFGEDPREVSKYVNAFIAGCHRGGVLATVKHFPGHGDTDVDSHRSLPVLNVNRKRLDEIELLPFREAFAAGCRSVMIAHLAVPVLDKTPAPILTKSEKVYGGDEERELRGTLPATVSHEMVKHLLRGEMGFDGIVVTDAMDMGGLADHYTAEEGAIAALIAGCDHILKSGKPEQAIEAVINAVKSGRIAKQVIDDAVMRILKEKQRLQLFEGDSRFPSLMEVGAEVASPAHDKIIQQIAERSITCIKNDGTLPLRKKSKIAHIAVTDEAGAPAFVYSTMQFGTPLKPFCSDWLEFRVNPFTKESECKGFAEIAMNVDAIVISLNVKARTGAGTIATPKNAIALAEHFVKLKKPVVAVSLGSPYLIQDMPFLQNYLIAYGSADASQRAAARAIFGDIRVNGKIPVSIPGIAKRGDGVTIEKPIQ